MKRLRVLIIDDEPLVRERIAALVGSDAGLEWVGEATNGLEALDLIARLGPDLILLDVEMPELSGLGVIAALDSDRLPAIVFITAYEQYAVAAFEVGAVDYLHKPITASRFATAIGRVRERLPLRSAAEARAVVKEAGLADRARGPRVRFVVRSGHTHVFVPVETVDWIDGADNYLRLHAGGATHLWRGTIKQVAEELDPARFLRIHRSVIVAIDRIEKVRSVPSGGCELVLTGGTRLRSSRPYLARVRALLRSGAAAGE